jgi:hypothetical protein
LHEADGGHLTQRHGSAIGKRHQNLACDGLWVAAQVAGIADADAVTLPAFDRGGHDLRAEARGHDLLYVTDHQSIAGELGAVRLYLEPPITRSAKALDVPGTVFIAASISRASFSSIMRLDEGVLA